MIYTCAYKYKYDKYEPNPANTFKGEIVNAAAGSMDSIEEILEYYNKNINTDFRELEAIKLSCIGVREHINELKETTERFRQERKFGIRWNDLYIDGTPDLCYKKDGIWYVEDIKMSTH